MVALHSGPRPAALNILPDWTGPLALFALVTFLYLWLLIRLATWAAESPPIESPPTSQAEAAALRRWAVALGVLWLASWIAIAIGGSAGNLSLESIFGLLALSLSLLMFAFCLWAPVRHHKRMRNISLSWVLLGLSVSAGFLCARWLAGVGVPLSLALGSYLVFRRPKKAGA